MENQTAIESFVAGGKAAGTGVMLWRGQQRGTEDDDDDNDDDDEMDVDGPETDTGDDGDNNGDRGTEPLNRVMCGTASNESSDAYSAGKAPGDHSDNNGNQDSRQYMCWAIFDKPKESIRTVKVLPQGRWGRFNTSGQLGKDVRNGKVRY